MSNLIHTEGYLEVFEGQGGLGLYSHLMAPNHGRVPIAGLVRGTGDALEFAFRFVIDGNRCLSPFHHRIYTVQELADLWERCHHEHHGYDPRGLDPRVEPTRLTIPIRPGDYR